MQTSALPDLADPFRQLLKVVSGVLRAQGWRGWLGAPMALWVWMRTRRERREAAMMLEMAQGLVEMFLAMFEEWKAGKLAGAVSAAAPTSPGLSAPEGRRGDDSWVEWGRSWCGAVESRLWGDDSFFSKRR